MRKCTARNEDTMSPKKNIASPASEADELRRLAEAKLRGRKKKTAPLQTTDPDTLRLVHELQVHQIELEMQNEELIEARAELEATMGDQYADLYDFAPVGYFTLTQEGRIQKVNFAGARLLGTDRSTLSMRRFGQFVAFDSHSAFNLFLKQVFLPGRAYKEVCELALQAEGRETYWVHIEAAKEDTQSEVCRAVVVDITERKHAEEKLKYQANLLANVKDAVTASDEKYILTSWNHAAEEMFGWQAEEVLGKTGAEIFRSKFIGMDREEVFRRIQKTGQFRGEVIQYRKDGTHLFVEANTYAVRNEAGSITGYVTVSRDITERKRAEEALRTLNAELEQHVAERTLELTYANRAKDEFLANMSHELRTPLSTILGLSEVLLEQTRGPLTEAQQRALQLITASGKHLLGLINDILEVSKIDAGKLQIHPDIISVKEICESSLNFVAELAIKKSITLDFWNNENISTLYADPQRLKQILINLLNNAVKFTPEKGNVNLEVEFNAERDQIQFIISDTGIGIAPDDLQKLFTPFSQLDSALARQYSGTGLGLVLVHKFTELHGGSVQVESEVGKGSRFAIYLPWDPVMTKPDLSAAIKPMEIVQATEPPRTFPIRVLLADDHETNTWILCDYLQAHGYEVTTARDGVEAVAKAGETLPHIILMDIQIPVLNGMEAMSRLRADPRFESTPIIALTALAMPGDRERCLEAGANEYLSKPVSLKALVKTIDGLLSGGQ